MLELLPLFFALVGGMIVLAACAVAVLAKRLILRLVRGAANPVRWRTLGIAAFAEIPSMIVALCLAFSAIPSDPVTLRERPGLFFAALFGSATLLHAFFALIPHVWLVRKIEAAAGQSGKANDALWLAFLLGLPTPLLVSALALGLLYLTLASSAGPLPFMYAMAP